MTGSPEVDPLHRYADAMEDLLTLIFQADAMSRGVDKDKYSDETREVTRKLYNDSFVVVAHHFGPCETCGAIGNYDSPHEFDKHYNAKADWA